MDTNLGPFTETTHQTGSQLMSEESMLDKVDPMRVHQQRVLASMQSEYIEHITDGDNLFSHHPLYKRAKQCVVHFIKKLDYFV